jgi:hypothetical protein
MASSRLITRHARETSATLAPESAFAKFESRRHGNFLPLRNAQWDDDAGGN